MAVQLHMTQSNYCKLEKGLLNESTLLRIATVLNTTPEQLQHYHLSPKQVLTTDDYHNQLINQKDEMIRVLQEQIQAQREIITDLRERLAAYLQGGGK